ncbi:MAG: acylneuraminate cytidylyltransferase family protein [Rhodospirillales bacterium]|jgi:CMP-N,N'-diacetyllegionaminic acid synthase|nr:acylneuraminate cytidylyltransferase family protein [Rhodospirillales bacterium]MBT4626134.1 acylneuraminate cytidylyltransferase family protein [Rhodospirillales bacterium]MBT5350236.1 acylneuraminate cytidylyltransferase family protein [Rhodospirillales bacterium]MBT5522274.1 acylneuraminate cytidylyltransferase family protein [Rhodospirillales bacterium]MBT6109393.1 acylneuraminate cytidylyltransferase family protein [Rhodospirillales bacterium]
MTSYLAFIPARGGSKGLPGKNLRVFAGKPLISWSIEQALAAPEIDRVLVSTDDTEIAEVARACGADVPFLRPENLASDTSTTESAMQHALVHLEKQNSLPDVIILLQPTSPVRSASSISRAIHEFESTEADSLISVCESHVFIWKNPKNPQASYDVSNRPRRQDIPEDDRIFLENGSIYMTKTDLFQRHNNRLVGKIHMFEMGNLESREIDDAGDFAATEALMACMTSET